MSQSDLVDYVDLLPSGKLAEMINKIREGLHEIALSQAYGHTLVKSAVCVTFSMILLAEKKQQNP